MQKIKENCMNCGAVLHYDETSYGKLSKCKYCGTEYHIDMLGRVEEYKVKIKMQNKIVSFYINSITVEPQTLASYRTFSGELHTIQANDPNITLELISYKFEEIEKGD